MAKLNRAVPGSKPTGKPQKKAVPAPTLNLPDKPKANTAPKGIDLADLIAYRKKGLTLEEIGTLTGCTRQTVCERLQHADLEGLEQFSEHKDKILEHKQREIVNSLTDAKVKDMSGLQLITGAAILQDKIATIRGQATSIIDHRHLSIDLSEAVKALRKECGNSTNEAIDAGVEIVSTPKLVE